MLLIRPFRRLNMDLGESIALLKLLLILVVLLVDA
jgi:hypothetical protein